VLGPAVKLTPKKHSLLLVGRDDREIEVELSASPILDHKGRRAGAVIVMRDVGTAQELTRKLHWHENHDVLTGFENRAELELRLAQAIASARTGQAHALLYLDLDQFKIVNDTCGHAAGDELLRYGSHLIASHLRQTDTLARLGGDEFGVLLMHCSVEQAMDIAHKVRRSVRRARFAWEDKIFAPRVSVGVVHIDGTATSGRQILSAAD